MALVLTEHGSLKQKAIRSSIWVLAGNGITQAAALARTVVFARLLTPHDVGLMGIAMVALVGLDTFTRTGYGAALVQRPGEVHGYLDTVFSIQVIRGLILTVILYFAAPLIAGFFRNLDAVPVIRAIGVAVFILGLTNPAIFLFQKNLDFKRQVFWNLSEVMAGLLVGVVLAFALRNVWALVGAHIAACSVKTAMSYLMQDFRPRWRIDWKRALELSRFGKWVFGTNVVAYLSTNLDIAVIGRLLGTSSVGFYQTAYRISNLPATMVSQVFSNIAFPVYARVQSDLHKVRRVFFSGLSIALLVGLPIALVFAVLAKPLVSLVLGEKWLPAAPCLQALAAYGFFRILAASCGILFEGVGRPASNTKMNVYRLTGLAILIIPCTHYWGLAGASWAAVGSIAITLPYGLNRCSQILAISPSTIIRQTLRPLLLAGIGFALPLVGLAVLLPSERMWGLALTAALPFVCIGLLTVAFFRVSDLTSFTLPAKPGSST